MSTIKVVVTKVEIFEHRGADRLELARINGEGGFVCVVGKDQFKTGDLGLYFPPDSIMTDEIMVALAKNKVTMKSNRLRAINIRKEFSEGLCLSPREWLPEELVFDGSDVTSHLGIKKYTAPVKMPNIFSGQQMKKREVNELFHKYTDIERIQSQTRVFDGVDEVVATKKLHGTNFRGSYLPAPKHELSLLQRIKAFFTRKSIHKVYIGSHNMQRRDIDTDLYWNIAKKYNLEEKLKSAPGLIIYGEIIGPSVQKGYDYGLKEKELRVFDMKRGNKYLSYDDMLFYASKVDLAVVEEVYIGPPDIAVLSKLAQDIDEYNGKKFNREGIVVKPLYESKLELGTKRRIAKFLNPDYLLDKSNSEWH